MVRVLGRSDIERIVGMNEAIAAVRAALVAADEGKAITPPPFDLRLPDVDGELHVKGAYLTGAGVFAVKTATGFYRNASRGLPVSSGVTLVHDATTGVLTTLIADGGLLTELRTAAAGAVAADLLARASSSKAAVIGAGGQARFQLLALLRVRPIREVAVWARRDEAARRYQRDLAEAGVAVSVCSTPREAVSGADVIITATSSSEPLVYATWLSRGSHVTAMGSDMPHKHELDPRVLAVADKYVPDNAQAAARSGELHHAIEAAVVDVASVYGELPALASGRLCGRSSDDELTVADLTGLGLQDAAVAGLAARLAEEQGAGHDLPIERW